MHNLGQTRSAYRADHLLSTPDTFIRAPLPGMRNATAIVHVSPARGAAFTQFTALFETGGELGPAALQRFFYVIEGNSKSPARLSRPEATDICPPDKTKRFGRSCPPASPLLRNPTFL